LAIFTVATTTPIAATIAISAGRAPIKAERKLPAADPAPLPPALSPAVFKASEAVFSLTSLFTLS
jgi:hypothetical protein